jgi:hypothetical protein
VDDLRFRRTGSLTEFVHSAFGQSMAAAILLRDLMMEAFRPAVRRSLKH